MEGPFSVEEGGLRLAVRLSPRASKNALTGVVQDSDGRSALQLRLTAPPVEGAANKALIAFLAAALGLRRGDIQIRSGETARLKILHLDGDSGAIAARLTTWISRARGGG
jgi:uncharacterized protein